jgi:hypothetical protein
MRFRCSRCERILWPWGRSDLSRGVHESCHIEGIIEVARKCNDGGDMVRAELVHAGFRLGSKTAFKAIGVLLEDRKPKEE